MFVVNINFIHFHEVVFASFVASQNIKKFYITTLLKPDNPSRPLSEYHIDKRSCRFER